LNQQAIHVTPFILNQISACRLGGYEFAFIL
jgi:hypothetical protein